MPTYTPRASALEVEEFTGGWASAHAFGMRELRRKERSADRDDPAHPNWSEVTEEGPFFTLDGVTEVLAGEVLERQAAIDEGPQARGAGAWKPVGNTRTPEARKALALAYVRIAVNWEAQSAPGAPMRTANGLRMFTETGEDLLRPAIGEQDLSSLTGLPLWADDAETIPVLVTE